MAEFTVTIPDPKVQRVLDAFSGMYPPEAGFNDAQWAKEMLKRYIRKTVARYETMVAQQAAVVPEDNAIVEVT